MLGTSGGKWREEDSGSANSSIRKVTGPERILEIINITDSVKYVSDRSNSTDRTNSG